MNPMFAIFQHKSSAGKMMDDHGIMEGDAMRVKSAAWFCQMHVSNNTTSTDFPAMPTPVTWWNVKPHWR